MKKEKKPGHVLDREKYGLARPSGRLWVENSEGETLMSWARATVLDRIENKGSLRAAAQSMGISYVKAWRLVKLMNSTFPKPLVKLNSGGSGGGGAKVTEEGKQASNAYWRLIEEFNQLELTRFSGQFS